MTTVAGDQAEVPEAGSGDAMETPAQKTPGRGWVGTPFQHQPERAQRQPRRDVAVVQCEVRIDLTLQAIRRERVELHSCAHHDLQ